VIRFAWLVFVPALAFSAPTDWRQNLSPAVPGAFPLPRALKAHYEFGWSKLHAGQADAIFSKPGRNTVLLQVNGGTTGLVRDLWRLDATHRSVGRASTLHPLRTIQIEVYSNKTTTTRLDFDENSVVSIKRTRPPNDSQSEKKTFIFPNIYDLHTALLAIRSQRLQTGDVFNLVVFPANAPYLATVRVVGREKIRVHAGKYSAVKFDLRLQKINTTLGLEPHRLFKRGTAWISDDADRILLRAEAEIFVGSVWAELQRVQFGDDQRTQMPR
jgi:hypothetical protein